MSSQFLALNLLGNIVAYTDNSLIFYSKSTLLNMLFGTTFATMDTINRKQTTKGIWLSKAVEADILVMDVEGTDGRERGDDQDFERKSALFSIVTTEILVVNMWESQVGLYNGANMGRMSTSVLISVIDIASAQDSFRGQFTVVSKSRR